MYCTVLYCTVLYCTVLYCTVLYCTVLYCTVLYCTVLYCRYPDPNEEFIRSKEFSYRLRKPRENQEVLAVKYADELAMLRALDVPADKTEADMLAMLDMADGDVQNAYQFLQ
jgi:hypothetical protein